MTVLNTTQPDIERRRFCGSGYRSDCVCMPSSLLLGCQNAPAQVPFVVGADVMDEALEMMSGLPPLTIMGQCQPRR